MPALPAPLDVSPAECLGVVGSIVVVHGLLAALPLALIGFALARRRRHRRAAADAEAAYRPDALLAPGLTTLFGTVEHAEGADHAVRVEVDQQGSEHETSGAWAHAWNEVNRRVKVHPFYIRHVSGRRVRVEPQRDVYLVDAMDGVIRVDLTQRTRIAELTPGEEVFAHGLLVEDMDPEGKPTGGYRDEPRGLVLRSPRGGRMLLSTERLGARFLERAGVHRMMAGIFAGALVLAQLALLPYNLRLLAGRTVEARVVRLEHFTTKDDEGGVHQHYKVHTTLAGGAPFADEVSETAFRSLSKGDVVLVRRAPVYASRLSNIGARAEVHWAAVVPAILMGALILIYWIVVTRKRWYEGRVHDTGAGQLHESLGSGKESFDEE